MQIGQQVDSLRRLRGDGRREAFVVSASEAEKKLAIEWRGPKEVCGLARFAFNLVPERDAPSFCTISP